MGSDELATTSFILTTIVPLPDLEFNSSTAVSNETAGCGDGSLTDTFGIVVQFFLALIAFSCLIVKRFCEPITQRRSWLVWFYDTSKQGVSAGLIHFANIFLSQHKRDPCIWYVMNFLLDSTGTCCNCKELRNGDYGDPPKFKRWIIQCIVYSLVMMTVKGLIVALMTFDIWKTISTVIMSPIHDDHLEVILVMFVIPIIVNALIFWVVDNFLMNSLRTSSTKSRSHKYSKLKTDIDLEERGPIKSKPESSNGHDS